MQRSRQELEAAVLDLMRERAWQINKNPKYRELWSVELVEAIELAVTILRETAAGMDGFEAWHAKFGENTLSKTDARTIFFAGRASASADVDALADEVERQGSILRDSYSLVSLAWHRYGLRNRIHELKDENIYDWEKMLADLDSKSPARVRDILAARRKEGK